MDISLKHLRMISKAIKTRLSALKRQQQIYGHHHTEIEEYEQLAEMIDDLILKQ